MKKYRRPKPAEKLQLTAYRSGANQTAIARSLNIDRAAVRYHPRAARESIRPQGEVCQKHSLNQAAFDEVTEGAAYWIGFLIADGSIRLRKGKPWGVALALSPVDRQQLEAFRAFLGSTHAIVPNSLKRPRRGKIGLRFRVTSTRLAERLSHFGVVARKAGIEVAKAGLEDNTHFWRGCFDGDGCLRWTSQRGAAMAEIRTAGASRQLMEQFAAYCRRALPALRARVRFDRGCWVLHTTGATAAPITRALYGAATLALARKHLVAKEIISRYFGTENHQ